MPRARGLLRGTLLSGVAAGAVSSLVCTPSDAQLSGESDRAKPAHGGVKTKNFAQIVLIYAGLERSELASASAKHKQLIAAVFDALLPSRPWFCPRKPRALPPVAGEAGCSVAADDLCHGYLAPICSAMSPLFLARPLPLHFPLL